MDFIYSDVNGLKFSLFSLFGYNIKQNFELGISLTPSSSIIKNNGVYVCILSDLYPTSLIKGYTLSISCNKCGYCSDFLEQYNGKLESIFVLFIKYRVLFDLKKKPYNILLKFLNYFKKILVACPRDFIITFSESHCTTSGLPNVHL